jgi:hypothetical protein
MLDRLRLIFLTHECLEAGFAPIHGTDSAMVMWYVRLPGTAHNPDASNQSVLEALSERSVLAMLCRYGQLRARFKPTATAFQNPFLRTRGAARRGKHRSRAADRSRPNPR